MNYSCSKKLYRKFVLSALFLSLILLSSLVSARSILAVIYQPGETLNPACAPTDTDCKVVPPAIAGTNSDITALTGLTTPLPVNEGGLGLTTIPAGALLYGAGSNTFATLSIGSTNQVLTVSGSGFPFWTSIYTLTPGSAINNTLRWDGSNWVESDILTNDGTSINITNLTVGSTGLVTNLNSNYLNGITSTGFVGIGQTDNFLQTGYTGFDNYNHWSLQTNGVGTTSILANNTVNFISGVGISLVQTDSNITINTSQNLGLAGSPTFASLFLTNSSNQLTFGLSGSKTILSVNTQTADRVVSLPALTSNDSLVLNNTGATLTNKIINAASNTISGLTTNNLSAGASIANSQLANPNINIITASGGGLQGGGIVGLGESLSLSFISIATPGIYGSATQIPVITIDQYGSVTNVTPTTISGLTSSNISATAGITNTQLSNNSISINPVAGTGISVSGSPVALGGSLNISGINATSVVKGVASFDATNFSVVSGAVDTIQHIDTLATPTFNSLFLTNQLSVLNTINQISLGVTNTTTISAVAPSTSRIATIPGLTINDTFAFVGQTQTFINKTINAASNTISNLTNSNLSGSAGITDANLATIVTANKVSGSAVQINSNGGIGDSGGLSILRTCADGQLLKWTASGGWACADDSSGGIPSVYADGGLLSDGGGLSLLRTCADGQLLKWTAIGGWACESDNVGGGIATVKATDNSISTTPLVIQLGPTINSADQIVVSDIGSSITRLTLGNKVVITDTSQTLTNKNISGGSNTITGLTNTNLLSGSAAITDDNLSTISTVNKVSGSAIQLSPTGGLTNNSGLSLLTTCSNSQVLAWNSSTSSWECGARVSILSNITAALSSNTINSADFSQIWNWSLTSDKTAFTFGENTAGVGGSGSQYILGVSTKPGSTASPFKVIAQNNTIFDTTPSGGIIIGSVAANQPVNIISGGGGINIGNSPNEKIINIGNHTGDTSLNLLVGTSGFTLDGTGSSNYSIGTSTTSGTINIGGISQTGTANLFTGNGGMAINLGTGAGSNVITIGNTTTATGIHLHTGTGNIHTKTNNGNGFQFLTNTSTDDSLRIAAGLNGGAASFEGTITSADLTAARTWTFQNNSGYIPLSTSGNNLFFTTSGTTNLNLPTSGTVTALGNNTTGSGTSLVLSTSPTFSTSIYTPLVVGGAIADNTLTLSGNNALSGNTSTLPNINFNVGNSGTTTAMTILNNGYVGIGTTAPIGPFELISQDDFMYITKYSNDNVSPGLVGRKARGTINVPLAVQTDDKLASLGGRGYDGSSFSSGVLNSSGLFQVIAGENFTTTNRGTYLSFVVTPFGSTNRSERMRLTPAGNLEIYNSSNQLSLGATNTSTTISASVPTSNVIAIIPALVNNDTFVFVGQTQTLTNKTLNLPIITGLSVGTGNTGIFIDSSGNLTKRSFGALAFLDSVTTGTTNGLSFISGNVGLGGTLTQNTNISTSSFNLSFLGLGNSQSLFIRSNGFVGIGTTSPNFGLSIIGSQTTGNIISMSNLSSGTGPNTSILRMNISATTGGGANSTRFVQFFSGSTTDNNGTGVGNIRLNNSGVTYGSGNADLAEWTEVAETVDYGDIISSFPTGNKKALIGNLLLGVITDTAAFVGNETADLSGKAIVGMLGRVNTKVSTENGDIAIGDPIAASSVAGVGMKQTKAGPTIGKALVAYSGLGVSRIAVQVIPGWYDPDPLLTTSSFSVGVSGDILDQYNSVVTRAGGFQGILTKDITVAKTLTLNTDDITDLTGNGLTLSSGSLSLNLGNSNVWTGLQTFNGGLAINGINFTTAATRLNYLSGISSTNGSLVIGVGSSLGNLNIGTSGQILMSNGSTPVWMTISGLGQTYSVGTGLTSPSTGIIALNLGSSNTWTALQTFNNGINVIGNAIFGSGENGTPSLTTIRGAAGAGSNIAGADINFDASNGTGSGGSGNLVFRTASGDTANASIGTSTVTGLISSTNNYTFSHTVPTSNTNRMLIVQVYLSSSQNVSTMTYGGVSMTGPGTSSCVANNASGIRTEVWYLINPPTGTNNVVINFGAYGQFSIAAINIIGASQSIAPVCAGTTGGGNSGTVSVTSAISDLVVDASAILTSGTMTSGASQSTITSIQSSFYSYASTRKIASSTSTTMSWTYGSWMNWALVAMSIKPSSSTNNSNTLAERLRITSSGRIGIGTASPGYILDVADIANFAGISIGSTTINTNAERLNYLSGISSTNGSLVIGVGSSLGNLNIGTSGQILMSNGSTPVWMTVPTLNLGSSNVWTGLQTFSGGIYTNTIKTGSGNLALNIGDTNSSDKFVIGNSGTTTPDLLVLDNGTTDPTGTNGAMYYNNTTNKFRCYENGSWRNCTGSNTSGVGSTFAAVTLGTGSSLVGTITVTPTTDSGDIYIYTNLFTNSLNNANQLITVEIRSGTNCSGTIITTGFSNLLNDSGLNGPSLFAATLISNAGASAHDYAICAKSDRNGGAAAGGLVQALVIDSGADLAEIYTTSDSSLTAGDVVSLDPLLQTGMKKSQTSYDSTVLGIISSKPGIIIGDISSEGVKALPVALSGRVPVKVNTEGGNIKAGDYLTTSSTPGVAMKAAKSGSLIGMAMVDYNGQGTGTILAFVQNGQTNGIKTASNLTSTDILANLLSQNSQISTTNLSEIVTDRAVAGLELVTPKITAQDIFATNATFLGTLTVDTLKANNIEGLDAINQKLADLQAQISTISSVLNIKDIDVSGGAKFNGPAEFNGPTIFKNMAEFIDTVIFRNRVQFADKDMGGVAIIKQSTSEIEVKFEKPYEQIPIVNTSLVYEGTDEPTFIEEGEKATVAYLNRDGFKIILPNFAIRDFKYHWMALYIKDAKTTVVDPTITPTLTPTPTPTIESIITPTLEPTITPTSEPTPTVTPAVLVTPTPSI